MLGNAGFNLRREVFIREQNVPHNEEFDADDLTATHLVVRQNYRGEGIARSLMTAAMDLARGDSRFQLDAQVDKIGFYEKFGSWSMARNSWTAAFPTVP